MASMRRLVIDIYQSEDNDKRYSLLCSAAEIDTDDLTAAELKRKISRAVDDALKSFD